MCKSRSVALLRLVLFFSLKRRRVEKKVLELNNQLIRENRDLNLLHLPNPRDGKFSPSEFLTREGNYSLLEPKK